MTVKQLDKTSGPERAADAIVSVLETRILSGELKNDEPLPPERDLIQEFGSSRTVVREAISELATRGLIELRPRYRPMVRKPDYSTLLNATGTIVRYLLNEPGGVQNLYQTRIFIERGLVRDAALSATKDDIAELKAALQANEDAIRDSREFFRTDIAFHGVLYRTGDNPILPAIHEGFSAWLSPKWAQMAPSAERNQTNYLAHKAIYDAILERDPTRAELALVEHLRVAWSYVEDTFGTDRKNA